MEIAGVDAGARRLSKRAGTNHPIRRTLRQRRLRSFYATHTSLHAPMEDRTRRSVKQCSARIRPC